MRLYKFAALLLVVSLAAFLRLYRLDLIEFHNDQARSIILAERVAGVGSVPEKGALSSVGAAFGPGLLYMLWLPALFGLGPRWLTAWVAATNIVAVVLTVAMAARWFGRRAGLIAGLAFAVSPWAVIFSRKVWEPSLLPILIAPLMWSLHQTVSCPRSRAVVALPILLCLACLLHFSAAIAIIGAVFLFLIFLLLSAPGLSQISWRWALLGTAAAAALAWPYLHFLYATGFSHLHFFSNLGHGSGPPLPSPGLAFVGALSVYGGDCLKYCFGDALPDFRAAFPAAAAAGRIGGVLAAALMLAGAITLAVRFGAGFRRSPGRRLPRYMGDLATPLVLVWALAAPVVLVLAHLFPTPHYLIVGFPAPFMLFAVGAEGAWSLTARASHLFRVSWHSAVGSIVAATIVGQILFLAGLLSFVDGSGGAPTSNYGVVLRDKVAAADYIASHSPNGAWPELAPYCANDEMDFLVGDSWRRRNRRPPDAAGPTPGPRRRFAVFEACDPPPDLRCELRRTFGKVTACLLAADYELKRPGGEHN